jgi:hypothetical protein
MAVSIGRSGWPRPPLVVGSAKFGYLKMMVRANSRLRNNCGLPAVFLAALIRLRLVLLEPCTIR